MVDGALAYFWYPIEFGLKDKKVMCQKYYYARNATMTKILLISLYQDTAHTISASALLPQPPPLPSLLSHPPTAKTLF